HASGFPSIVAAVSRGACGPARPPIAGQAAGDPVNVDRGLLRSPIARLGVEPHLTVTAEDCRSYKPARGHWDRFREMSGAAAAATVHVAASQFHDIVPATALGFRTVFVNRHGEPVAAAPTRAVPDLRALPEVIRDLAGP